MRILTLEDFLRRFDALHDYEESVEELHSLRAGESVDGPEEFCIALNGRKFYFPVDQTSILRKAFDGLFNDLETRMNPPSVETAPCYICKQPTTPETAMQLPSGDWIHWEAEDCKPDGTKGDEGEIRT